jgi:hypothetical protein
MSPQPTERKGASRPKAEISEFFGNGEPYVSVFTRSGILEWRSLCTRRVGISASAPQMLVSALAIR